MVAESVRPWAAIGSRAAAELYGCAILREGIEDEADNVTRFVWIAPAGTEPASGEAWKTSLVFSELGEDHPGALVDALSEFSDREINLSRIESRPLRSGLGRYMFFCDLEGAATDDARRRGDRGAPRPRPSRSGFSAPTRSAEQAQSPVAVAAWRPAYNSRQSWLESSYSTRRMSRSTSAR